MMSALVSEQMNESMKQLADLRQTASYLYFLFIFLQNDGGAKMRKYM